MKLLIVEDEEKLARSLERGLKAEGYIVDVTHDSDSAATLVDAGSYDLILLDWMIPGKHDGPALVKHWRAAHEDVPILMLTAKTTIGDRVAGLDAGADDYLTKPFSFDELLARVRALLRRPRQQDGGELVASGVHMDVAARTVLVNKKPVQLTAKEFQLLEYLIVHKGEVLSKDRLLDHVWSDESRVQHNTVETFVANIRKKVGRGIIKTVRGYGYKVE